MVYTHVIKAGSDKGASRLWKYCDSWVNLAGVAQYYSEMEQSAHRQSGGKTRFAAQAPGERFTLDQSLTDYRFSVFKMPELFVPCLLVTTQPLPDDCEKETEKDLIS